MTLDFTYPRIVVTIASMSKLLHYVDHFDHCHKSRFLCVAIWKGDVWFDDWVVARLGNGTVLWSGDAVLCKWAPERRGSRAAGRQGGWEVGRF